MSNGLWWTCSHCNRKTNVRLHLVSFKFILEKHAKPSLPCLETTTPPTFTEEIEWSGTVAPFQDPKVCCWVVGFLGPPTTLYISKSSSFESFARSSWRPKIRWQGEGLQGQIAKDVHQTQKAFQARMPFFFHLSLTFFVGRSDGKPMLHLLQKHHPARLNLFGGSSRVVAQIVPMISLCNGTWCMMSAGPCGNSDTLRTLTTKLGASHVITMVDQLVGMVILYHFTISYKDSSVSDFNWWYEWRQEWRYDDPEQLQQQAECIWSFLHP